MREHRTSYCAPSGDIASSVMVCVVAVPAYHTLKNRLGFPVFLGDMPARHALPAGVARIDNRNGNAGLLGLIFDKGAKLAKTPIVQTVPLLFSGLNLDPDMRQIFQRDTQTGAFSSGNDALGNAMILMLLKACLLAADGAQAALGRPGASALQGGAALGVALARRLHLVARVLPAQAVSGNVDDAEIDAKDAVRRQQGRVVKVAHDGQIPLAAHEHQIHFAFAVLQQLTLVFTANVSDFCASLQQPDRHDIAIGKAENPVVVRLRRMFAKSTLRFLVDFVRIRHFGNATHRHLRAYFKFGAQLVITKFVEVELPEYLGFKSPFSNPVARGIAPLKRRHEHTPLLLRRR